MGELEERLARCEAARRFEDQVDGRLEQGLRAREPLERVVPDLLRMVADATSAITVVLHTLDESLHEQLFVHGDPELIPELLAAEQPAPRTIAQPLDVAGESLGAVVLRLEREPTELDRDLVERLSEHLDNHLAAIAQARRRFEVIRAISDALKDPVLDAGINRAIEILAREVGFEDLVLVFRHEETLEDRSVRYKVYRHGKREHDSASPRDREVDHLMRESATAFLEGEDEEVRERFGIRRYREEVLITGVRAARVIGRLLVTSAHGEFHTYDRELLDRFADYLRQRIVDFNREWKILSRFFPPPVCERLLHEEGYVQRWLTPREREIAVMFADLAGFTRLSEQVLREPESIGRLIALWSEAAVQILWETGGVFDKMVGDCIIAHFGPPFFDASAKDNCEHAIEAAVRLRELTRSLGAHPELPELHGQPPPEVAIGINHCMVSVGLFGRAADYTAFSSGMNNTARLQGIAHGGEILCMQSVVDSVAGARAFGPPREAQVKNVQEPLRFRALA